MKNYVSILDEGVEYSDALGWGSDQYASTINFGKLDNEAGTDICGRGSGGLVCALSE